MSSLHLSTLGELKLTGSNGELLVRRRKELVLLAYLARRAPRAVPRDELAELLWGESGDERARHSLRQALLRLKPAVGEAVEVSQDSARVPAGVISLDAQRFEQALCEGRPAESVALWKGDFLAGLEDLGCEAYREWVERERGGFRRNLGTALLRLVQAAEAKEDWAEAGRWAERWTEVLPFEEAGHVQLVHSLRQNGLVADARTRYAAALDRLRGELGVEPSADFLRIGEELNRATVRPSRRPPGSAALLTPDLVGREPILATLRALWQNIATQGAAVLLEGEEGMGKSRTALAFLRGIREVHLFEARAGEGDSAERWTTLRRLLAPLAASPCVADAPARAAGDLSAILPELRVRFPQLPEPRGSDSPELGAAALCEILRATGAPGRTLLFLDDAARADPASAELLLHLLRRLPSGILVLLASATEDLLTSCWGAELAGLPRVHRLKLQPLSVRDTDALLASMLEMPDQERSALASCLHTEVGGNPQDVAELVSALADAGLLRLGPDGVWRPGKDLATCALPLPGGLRGAVAHRLASLDPAARRVLDAAAVLGSSEPALLRAVAALPAAEFEAGLAELLARRLLRQAPNQGDTLELPRATFRRAAYELIAPARRQTLHAAAQEALREIAPADALTRQARAYHQARAGPRAGRRLIARRLLPLGAMLLALGLVGTLAARRWTTAAGSVATDRRVLVARFGTPQGDSGLDGVGEIAAHWVSEGIARTGLAHVVPSAAPSPAPQLAGEDRLAAARRLARDAGAGTLVFGEVLGGPDSLRFQVRVVDPQSGELLGNARTVAAPRDQPMAAMEPLRQSTLAALAPLLDPRMADWARVSSTPPSYGAYLAFAEGLDAYNAREPGRGATGDFLKAYALDTSFTLPLLYAALSETEASQLASADSLLRLLLPRRESLPPFEQHVLDYLAATLRGDRARQLRAAEAAARLAPQSLLAAMERPEAAIALNQPRLALVHLAGIDPERASIRQNAGYWDLRAQALHMVGDYRGQLATAEEMRRRFPQDTRALSYRARALAALGRLSELDALLQETLLLPPVPGWGAPGLLYHIGACDELRVHGHGLDADRLLARAVAFYQTAPEQLRRVPKQRYEMGRAFFRLGRLDEAAGVFTELTDRQAGVNPIPSLLEEIQLDSRVYLGKIAAVRGDSGTWHAVDRWLAELKRPYLWGWNTESRAALHALAGDREAAVRLLRQAVSEGRPYDAGKHLIFEYRNLRGYPPYEEWLRPKG